MTDILNTLVDGEGSPKGPRYSRGDWRAGHQLTT